MFIECQRPQVSYSMSDSDHSGHIENIMSVVRVMILCECQRLQWGNYVSFFATVGIILISEATLRIFCEYQRFNCVYYVSVRGHCNGIIRVSETNGDIMVSDNCPRNDIVWVLEATVEIYCQSQGEHCGNYVGVSGHSGNILSHQGQPEDIMSVPNHSDHLVP